MSRYLLLIMGSPLRWLRLADGVEGEAGEGLASIPPLADGVDETVAMIVPAADVSVNYADMPGLTSAQARAAARLLASESSVAPLETLHVATGEADGNGDRLIAAVDHALMAGWLAEAQAAGFDPELVVPASLLLPRPEDGYVRAALFGTIMLRGRTSAFADEPGLTTLILGEAAVEDVDASAGLAAMLADPPVNLRQGAFARRTRWQVDWKLVKRLGWLGAAVLLVTLAIHLMLIMKYSVAADALELKTAALARTGVPGISAEANAEAELEARLAASRGGGAGFATSTAAIFTAVRSVPNVELTAFDFGVDGSLRLTLAAATVEDIAAFQRAMERYGFDGTATAPQVQAGRQMVELTVRLP